MARKAFLGNDDYRLPKKQEAYRLWFEYLKLALSDKDIKVDRSFYKDWGDVANTDFDDWWDDHWQFLFAVPAPTKVIKTVDEFNTASADQNSLVLRISLGELKKRRERDIASIIKHAQAKQPRLRQAIGKPRFEVGFKRSVNFKTFRVPFRIYQFWLSNNRDLRRAVRTYYLWADAWNKKNPKRQAIQLPRYFKDYISALDKIERRELDVSTSGRKSISATDFGVDWNLMRFNTRRYLSQAQKIAQNVARGIFPGKY